MKPGAAIALLGLAGGGLYLVSSSSSSTDEDDPATGAARSRWAGSLAGDATIDVRRNGANWAWNVWTGDSPMGVELGTGAEATAVAALRAVIRTAIESGQIDATSPVHIERGDGNASGDVDRAGDGSWTWRISSAQRPNNPPSGVAATRGAAVLAMLEAIEPLTVPGGRLPPPRPTPDGVAGPTEPPRPNPPRLPVPEPVRPPRTPVPENRWGEQHDIAPRELVAPAFESASTSQAQGARPNPPVAVRFAIPIDRPRSSGTYRVLVTVRDLAGIMSRERVSPGYPARLAELVGDAAPTCYAERLQRDVEVGQAGVALGEYSSRAPIPCTGTPTVAQAYYVVDAQSGNYAAPGKPYPISARIPYGAKYNRLYALRLELEGDDVAIVGKFLPSWTGYRVEIFARWWFVPDAG